MSIAEKFEVIADAVYEKGVSDGKKSQNGLLWDDLFPPTRTYFPGCFAEWTPDIFYPTKDIILKGDCSNAFYMFKNNGQGFDLVKRLKECGATLDISSATRTGNMFAWSDFKSLPAIDLTGFTASHANYTNAMFSNCTQLISIEKLIVTDKIFYSNMFAGCKKLQEIEFEGVIVNSLSFGDSSDLNKKSINSTVNALSPTVTGQSITLSKQAVNNAFGINVDDASTFPEGSEYYNLRYSKSNWTFNYV